VQSLPLKAPYVKNLMMISNTTYAIGWKATDFALQGVDGKTYSLAEVRGPKGTLVVFICNHCPYVKACISRIVAEANALRGIGIGTIAIMPNDTETYPDKRSTQILSYPQERRPITPSFGRKAEIQSQGFGRHVAATA
jgi:hypothetical protein